MTITVAQFRADFPEFASTVDFPNSGAQFWLGIAYQLLNASRWGAQLDLAVELFTAHNLAIEAKASRDAKGGGIPGQQAGPINSKSVSSVSVGYDSSAALESNAGHWNLTVYGTRLIRLIRMFGAGPIFVGVGSAPSFSGSAWTGPLTTPGFTNFGN